MAAYPLILILLLGTCLLLLLLLLLFDAAPVFVLAPVIKMEWPAYGCGRVSKQLDSRSIPMRSDDVQMVSCHTDDEDV